MEFKTLKTALTIQMKSMSSSNWYTSKACKDELWDMYLSSFPEGSNPIFRERTEHDCNCCKQFIRAVGGVLTIKNNKLVSIWDLKIDGPYAVVAAAMSQLVKQRGIDTKFYHYMPNAGTDVSNINQEKWNHFHFILPIETVIDKNLIATRKGKERDLMNSLKRSILEIRTEHVENVLELIKDGNLYKGSEYKSILTTLLLAKQNYKKARNKERYLWETSLYMSQASAIRTTVIGTLLTDLAKGIPFEEAVKMFESKVAPLNYKRSKAVVSKAQIKRAEKTVTELGLGSALLRRHAVVSDVTINNVLFADRTAQAAMGVFDSLAAQVPDKEPDTILLEEVPIHKFISDYLPKASTLEVLMTNKHASNLMSLVAPVNADAPSILNWNNNFSWTYKGEATDSIKDNVESAGGKTKGILRFSIQWNDKVTNLNDLDAQCIEPNGHKLFYGSKSSSTSGSLDVDIQNPNGVAVENIIYTNIAKMPDGKYVFEIVNYADRRGKDWTAEIEFAGQTFSFSHTGKCANKVLVATVVKTGSEFKLLAKASLKDEVKTVWGVNTLNFHKVNLAMRSPNFWDGQGQGNEHVFFILDNCINPDSARGLYSEFLKNELHDHRKVFEMLGAQLKAPYSTDQLSGLGFSLTVRNSIICRVRGEINKNVKILF